MTTPAGTSRVRRAIVIVCDGLGVGAAPDAEAFGDAGSDTLGHVLASRPVAIPNLRRLGLGRLVGIEPSTARVDGAFGKMAERSAGKDTTTGHWEMTGVVTDEPFRTFPGGFPPDIVAPFEAAIGRKVLGNKAASGTEILKELGEEHLRTGRPILYTSIDSVFQLAAHEERFGLDELYRICRIGYGLACERFGVCRVIARPFLGATRDDFRRTAHRRDFAVPPPGVTLLDRLAEADYEVFGIGKIEDIFSGRGLSGAVHTRSDEDGIERTLEAMGKIARGLIFTNLVDFDTLYGHRNDVEGYARNLEMFDRRVPDLLAALGPGDLLVITADHGCDPADVSTDHTREYVPLLVSGPQVRAGLGLGSRASFADLGATLAEAFGVAPLPVGESFLSQLFL